MTVQPPTELAAVPENADALAAMRRAVERSTEFHLYAVRCPENMPEKAVAHYLVELGRVYGRPLEHRDVRDAVDPLTELDCETGLVLTGLGAHLARDSDVAVALNLERNNLPRRIGGPLFLVMPSTLMDTLMVWAPDLWSTVTGAWEIAGRPSARVPDAPSAQPPSRELEQLREMAANAKEGGLEPAIRASLAERAARESARCFRYDEAAEWATEAVDGYRKLGDEDDRARATLTLADALRRTGRLVAAEGVLRDALAFEATLDEGLRALIHLLMGQVEQLQSRHVDSLASYRRAFEGFVQADDSSGQAAAMFHSGEALMHEWRYDEALTAFARAEELYEGLGGMLGLANVQLGVGELHMRAGRTSEASDAFEKAGELYLRVGDRLGVANAAQQIGEVLLMHGQKDAALDAFRRAREAYAAVGLDQGRARTLLSEGRVLLRLGRAHEALEALAHARDGFEAVGDDLGRAHAWRNLGDAWLQKEQLVDAERAFICADEIYERVGHARGRANAAIGLSRILVLQGEYEHATEMCGRALEIYRDAADPRGMAHVSTLLSVIAEARGDLSAAAANAADAARQEHACEDWHNWHISIRRQAELLNRLGRAEEAGSLLDEAAADLLRRGLLDLAEAVRT